MKSAIYVRVSTEEQAKSGYSLSDQIRSNRSKLLSMGVNDSDITEYIDDGYSGEFMERPALSNLRNDVRTGKISGYIVVLDPDRLSRNLTNTLILADEFEKSPATLTFITAEYDSSPEGKLFFSIRGAVAAFEKAKTRERTIRGKKEKALSGKIIAPHPKIGYDVKDSMYLVNEEEAKLVRRIFDMCIKDNLSLKAITRKLTSEGIKNKRGNPLTFRYIYSMLLDETYTGVHYQLKSSWKKISQNKYEVKNFHKSDWLAVIVPKIIEKETLAKAKKQLSKNIESSNRNKRRDYMLTGVIECGLCGKGMTAISFNHRSYGSESLRYYICYGKRELKICPDSAYIPVDEIEAAVWEQIIEIANTTGYLPCQTLEKEDKAVEISRFITRKNELTKQKDSITSLVLDGLIETEKARKKLRQINNDLTNVSFRIEELKNQEKNIKNESVKIDIKDVAAADTTKKKNALLKQLGITIVVSKKKRQDMKFQLLIRR